MMCKALWYYYKCQSEALSHLLVLELLLSEIACQLCLTPHLVSGDGVLSLQSDHHPQNTKRGKPNKKFAFVFFSSFWGWWRIEREPTQGFNFFSISTGLRMQSLMVQLGTRIFCCWTCSNGKETLGVVVGPFLLVFCLCKRVTLNPKPMLTWAVQGNKDEHKLTMIKNDDASSLNYYTHSFTKPIVK